MTPRPFLAPLAALLLAALFLAGCGGGGGDGGKNDTIAMLEADVAMLQADLAAANNARSAAERARQAAEAAEADAEAARAEAEAAKETAEMARNEANAAAGAAQALAEAAAQKQEDAEALRDAAVAARDAAIAARDAAITAQQTAEDARDAALADKMTAEDALAAANAQATVDLAALRQQLATANANLQTAQNALDDANGELREARDDLKTAQDALQTANDELVTVRRERDDALRAKAVAEGTLEGLRSQLTQAQQDAADAEQRRREAEAEAQRKIDEAEQQANVSVRATPMLTAMDGAAEAAAIVQHMPSPMTLRFQPAGNFPTSATAPTVPGGWRSGGFTRVTGAGTETVYLYTDIGSPAGRHFWKVHGEKVESGTWTLALAKPTAFGTAGTVRSLYQDTGGTPQDKTGSVSRGGTYNGYSGTFSCVGTQTTGCNMAAGANNALTGVTGDWTFKANATAAGTPAQDAEFLYFGIWATDPTLATAAHTFNWIAGGDGDVETQQIDTAHFGALATTLTGGTATFNGGAVGRYLLRNQVGRVDRIGTFTATASFTANFTNDTLEGSITEFKEGGTALVGWNVFLGSSPTAAAGLDAAGTTGTPVATASIGGVSATGAWAATLHGSNNPGYTAFGTGADAVRCPVSGGCPSADLAGVAGWFDAFSNATTPTNSDAAIVGAFAAK